MTETKLPYELTPVEAQELPRRVMDILKEHRGASSAITGARMAERLGYESDRAIRVVIERLISDGVLVVASVHAPYGYFLLETEAEAELYEATLRSRAVKTLRRLKKFREGVVRRFGPARQLPLALVEQTIEELDR